MKICQIVGGDCHQLGGLEKHFIDQCNALANIKGNQLTAVGHSRYGDHLAENVEFIPLNLNRSRYNPIALLSLLKLFRKGKYDIVHAQASKATAMLNMLRNWQSFPFVATLHNLKKNVRAYQKPDHVICVSRRIAESITNPNVSVVYNGYSEEKSDSTVALVDIRSEFAIRSTDVLLVSIGRLVHAKGFDLLLKAVVGVDVRLVIVGDGPDKMALQQQAEELKIADRVDFAGFRGDVQRFIKAADFAVITSRREGFSYVMAEVLRNECPLISTDVADIRHIIGDQFTVPVEDVSALHKKMLWAISHQDQLVDEFKSTFTFALREFTLETMINNTMKIYFDVVNSKSVRI